MRRKPEKPRAWARSKGGRVHFASRRSTGSRARISSANHTSRFRQRVSGVSLVLRWIVCCCGENGEVPCRPPEPPLSRRIFDPGPLRNPSSLLRRFRFNAARFPCPPCPLSPKGGEVLFPDHPLHSGQAPRPPVAEHPEAENRGRRREEARRPVDEEDGERRAEGSWNKRQHFRAAAAMQEVGPSKGSTTLPPAVFSTTLAS